MVTVAVTKLDTQVKIDADKVEEMMQMLPTVLQMFNIPYPPLPPADSPPDPAIAPAAASEPAALTPEKTTAPTLTPEELKQQAKERMAHARQARRFGPTLTECIVQALKELGRPSSIPEIYEYMVNTPSIVYTTASAKPLQGIQEIIRQKKHLFMHVGKACLY